MDADASHADDGGIKGQGFWDSVARRMLAPALLLAAREHFTLDDVFGWVQMGSEDFITQRLDTVGDQRAIRPGRRTVAHTTKRSPRSWRPPTTCSKAGRPR